ncbi:MAG: chromosomal replication initiator protein DnaA, partial [Alistipes sp.]|nr:chromosomal replication initiator protein DnaA [Alistipes sp.]
MMANSQTYNEVWQACLNTLREHTSHEEFTTWFAPITPLAFDGTNLRLKVPNESYANHIEKNYLQLFIPIIMQYFGRQTRLVYAVPNSEERTPLSANADMTAISQHLTRTDTRNIPRNPFVIPGLKKVMFPTQLNAKYTFATHIEGECN